MLSRPKPVPLHGDIPAEIAWNPPAHEGLNPENDPTRARGLTVTVAEYGECVRAGKCKEPEVSSDPKWAPYYNWRKSGREDHPVNGVSWNDATAYCSWKGKRLPTEAEFEYALRGGRDGSIYPWGDAGTPPRGAGNYADESAKRAFPDWAIFSGYDDGYVGTAPVCSFDANPFGLCDISGNVWEWVADWYGEDYYASSPGNNPTGPSNGAYRVLRGGCWYDLPRGVRASYRYSGAPASGLDSFGFRCSRD